jgi:hypothetical protein
MALALSSCGFRSISPPDSAGNSPPDSAGNSPPDSAGFWPTLETLASGGVKPVASATLSSNVSVVEEKSRCPVPVLPCARSEKS